MNDRTVIEPVADAGLDGPRFDLRSHTAFARTFSPRKLTVGLILPLETHPGRPSPTMQRHIEMAQKAQALGFAALWMRDIPFYDPQYGDVGQIFEPLTYIAHLAAHTQTIALGTAGVVLPVREPLLLAKQVATIDQLSGGRMLLGLSSGDRPSDYPLFGIDMASRGDRLRDAFDVYRTVTEQSFPHFTSRHFGHSGGEFDLVPKPPFGRTPAIAVGRGQQSLEWIAANMDGFIAAVPIGDELRKLAEEWKSLLEQHPSAPFQPLGIGGFVDLVSDPDHPVVRIRGGIRAGSEALAAFLAEAQDAGVVHFAMNPKVSRRPYEELMDELADRVLSRFPSHAIESELATTRGSAT
jgi:luciferase-type oxidoreductase